MAFDIIEILNYTFLGNSVKLYLAALIVFVFAIIILNIFKKIVVGKIKQVADRTETDLDDLFVKIIDSIGWPFYVFLSLQLSLQFIQLPEAIEQGVSYAILILVTYYIIKGLQELIEYGTLKVIQKREQEEKDFDSSVIQLLSKILKGVLWAVAIIIILQNLGYNISALVAGLGIGGLAIAFALQNILGDIFASFSIYFDKPFQKGDFIIVGDEKGVVKYIGIKSTRLQTLQGEELIISNKELTEARVHNYKKMEKRRIGFDFGVTYNTPTEKLKKIPLIVEEIISQIELAQIDRVHFKEFGDFSLNFAVVYYVNTGGYAEYMDTQQRINLDLKERFEKEGIEFAYPTQTIFVNK